MGEVVVVYWGKESESEYGSGNFNPYEGLPRYILRAKTSVGK